MVHKMIMRNFASLFYCVDNQMCKLSIDVQSFHFSNGIIQPNDTIRVSITTLPDERKQALTIEEKKLKNFHHFFTINISPQTERILFVIRKKNFAQNNPIIASTIINSNQYPMSNDDKNNNILKNINLYEPVQKLSGKSIKDRKVLGMMRVQFSLVSQKKNYDNNNSSKVNSIKVFHQRGYSKSLDNNDKESDFIYSEYLLCN